MKDMEFIITKHKTLIIKGVAILFVIFSHCGLMECGGAIGVDLFLLVSGYGIYFSTKKTPITSGKRELHLYIFHTCLLRFFLQFYGVSLVSNHR